MEELQSTEVLDREILEDARKKAQRMLKSADEQVVSAGKDGEKRIEKAIEGLNRRHAGRLLDGRKEIMARLPLDRRRARLKTIDGFLRDAGRSYLQGLERGKILTLLEAELAGRVGELTPVGVTPVDGAVLKVVYRFMTREELETIMQKTVPRGSWTLEEESANTRTGSFPAFSIDDGAVRVLVSAEGALEALLEEKRGELAAVLLSKGERLPSEEALDA
jgi:vacuolar-type H+-ATPase subunit E/Vma4